VWVPLLIVKSRMCRKRTWRSKERRRLMRLGKVMQWAVVERKSTTSPPVVHMLVAVQVVAAVAQLPLA
jgi:hypothetical protein